MKIILSELFIRDEIATKGILLPLNGGTTVRITFGALLGDEEALTAMWCIKGASGLIPCGVMCSVTNKSCHTDVERGISSLAERDAAIPDLSCGDPSKLGLRTAKDLCDLLTTLEICPASDLEFLEHTTGLKRDPHSLLNAKSLRPFVDPCSTNRFDPMHVLFSNGLLGTELLLCLQVMKHTLGAYFEAFRGWNKEEGWSPSTQVFSETREKNATDHIKASASEFLSCYPLFRHFVATIYGEDAVEPHVRSLLLLCDILDIVRLLLKGADESVAHPLRWLVPQYLAAFVEAHGFAKLRIKHHELAHLLKQILLDGLMLSCWVTERKHIATTQAMAHNKNKTRIERTALSRCLNAQTRKLEHPGWISKLEEPARPFPELAAQKQATEARIARGMTWSGVSIKAGDVLFLDADRSHLVVVVACVAIDDAWGLMIRGAQAQSRSKCWSKWAVAPAVSYYSLRERDLVLAAAFHRYVGPACVEVLH